MKKWIIFRADKHQPGGLDRKYAHTGSLTKNLFEHIDSSDSELPEPGYRPLEFSQLEEAVDPQYPLAKTHYKKSDWEVVRVEVYTPDVCVGMSFDMIVVCICQYNPIDAPLKIMPERIN
jgi:hypothetical protein